LPVLAAWSRPVLSLCYTEAGSSHGVILSGRISTVAMYMSDQLDRCASVTHDRALKTCEPTCVTRAGKSFFIPVVHSPPGVVGHVAALELPSQGGRAQSHGTRGSTGADLSKEVRSRAEGHVVAPELTSARRRRPGPWDMWQHWSSSRQGGEVRGRRTCGSSEAHLYREVWSKATACVAAHGCTPCSLSSLRACMRGYPVFRVPTEAPEPTSEEAANPQVRPIFWRPTQLSYLFTQQSTADPGRCRSWRFRSWRH
jgi:hypothetical protein